MTMYEYDLLMTGKALKDVDESRSLHMQAFLNRQIKDTKDKKGSPKYKNFDDFFNYEKELDKITNDKERKIDSKALDLLFKANSG